MNITSHVIILLWGHLLSHSESTWAAFSVSLWQLWFHFLPDPTFCNTPTRVGDVQQHHHQTMTFSYVCGWWVKLDWGSVWASSSARGDRQPTGKVRSSTGARKLEVLTVERQRSVADIFDAVAVTVHLHFQEFNCVDYYYYIPSQKGI